MFSKTQRFTSYLVAFALLFPLSLFAENRSRGRTDLERLAADLERALGRGSVVVEGTQKRVPLPQRAPQQQQPHARATCRGG